MVYAALEPTRSSAARQVLARVRRGFHQALPLRLVHRPRVAQRSRRDPTGRHWQHQHTGLPILARRTASQRGARWWRRGPRARAWWCQRLACARAHAQRCAGYRPGPRASHQGRVRQRTCRLLRLCRLRSNTGIRAGGAAPPSRKHGMWVGAKEFTQASKATACQDWRIRVSFFGFSGQRCAGKLWSGRCEGAMPLRLNIRRKLTARSDRVKSVDVHPDEPWILCRYRPARSPARSSRACADPREVAGGSLPAGAHRGLCGRARKPAHEERAASASRLRASLRASTRAAEP